MIFFTSGSFICFFLKSDRLIFMVFYFLKIFSSFFISLNRVGMVVLKSVLSNSCIWSCRSVSTVCCLCWFSFIVALCARLFLACVLPSILTYLVAGTCWGLGWRCLPPERIFTSFCLVPQGISSTGTFWTKFMHWVLNHPNDSNLLLHCVKTGLQLQLLRSRPTPFLFHPLGVRPFKVLA